MSKKKFNHNHKYEKKLIKERESTIKENVMNSVVERAVGLGTDLPKYVIKNFAWKSVQKSTGFVQKVILPKLDKMEKQGIYKVTDEKYEKEFIEPIKDKAYDIFLNEIAKAYPFTCLEVIARTKKMNVYDFIDSKDE